ncbi:helix-turn-helix domain-containing protein [Rhodothermus profundi]|uniref:Helix-turn-helix domain-containing protein n=1 Tax=Rhodothermus profundi TaxID=633813 RepID=A0A1M6Q1H2_9BACT|nr:helix-turn-helix domain-containing protein [Rhodothermus profundi]SHK14080.1 Helix-turn-helix domain-containing protein [Rhodothermus profundi]
MGEQAVSESMRRLAHDLQRIRKKRKRSLEDIHQETKIALELLQHFERTALYDHERYNPVYLRSFVRTYANAIGIEASPVLEALELAFEGRYRNQLAVQFLGEDPLPEPEPEAGAVAAEPPSEAATDRATARQPQAPLPLVAAPGGLERMERPASWKVWAGGVAVAIGIGLGLWYLLRPMPTPPPEHLPIDTAVASAPDTVISAEGASAQAPVLGDTITATVIAAFDKVDPIRIRVDRDLRRPYWIEQGDSMRFRFTERIILENQLDDIQLLLNGYPYPTDQRDAQGRIVITRAQLQAYLDSLARSPR